ncbi:MAG: elongation factor G [Rhodospirillales bacterium]|nr:elongation factor G [Rhodospirillales bacterium]
MTDKAPSGPRCAVLVGSYSSGKTTLLEGMLFSAGAIDRKGSVVEGNSAGDASPEARERKMSTELNVASADYLGERWSFIDCPGNIELSQDAYNALTAADAAVVVCEPQPEKALAVAPVLRFLGTRNIPHMMFFNKMDTPDANLDDTLAALKDLSDHPFVLREYPIREGETTTGYVDLVSEKAYAWKEDADSEEIAVPESIRARLDAVRTETLESLADHDDALLEQLLEDSVPPSTDIHAICTRAFGAGLVVPVFFGSALQGYGIHRLLKALRHEVADAGGAAARLGIDASGADALAHVFKTLHATHTGKLSIARIWRGTITDGMTLDSGRVGGLVAFAGGKHDKVASAGAGEVIALGRMDAVATGAALTPDVGDQAVQMPETLTPLYSLAIHATERADEVKLTGALAKLVEEDPSLRFEPSADTRELLIWGQGDTHLQLALERLRNRYNLVATAERAQVPYKETIRKPVSQHARHKKQSGGHGQFGDVHVDIKPLARGGGFKFADSISGGVVPKQYIPAVAAGVRDYMERGPLGFPVVDISVTLTDGQFHAVDSSDMAFKAAAQLAMREGMPKASPVLLEPIFKVSIVVPNQFTSRIQRLVSGRRGQILGFEAKEGWKGWDEANVTLPQAEMHDLINELRSVTQGVGTFTREFDHLQECSGKQADQVIAARAQAAQ